MFAWLRGHKLRGEDTTVFERALSERRHLRGPHERQLPLHLSELVLRQLLSIRDQLLLEQSVLQRRHLLVGHQRLLVPLSRGLHRRAMSGLDQLLRLVALQQRLMHKRAERLLMQLLLGLHRAPLRALNQLLCHAAVSERRHLS